MAYIDYGLDSYGLKKIDFAAARRRCLEGAVPARSVRILRAAHELAYIVMASTVMAYTGMAYIVMACTVMA